MSDPTAKSENDLATEQTGKPEPVSDAAGALVLTPQPTAEAKAEERAEDRAAAKLAARQKKLDESSEQSPFSIVVGQVYDGPLDLLLDLIRKQHINIYDIPIALITAQYLDYLNGLLHFDLHGAVLGINVVELLLIGLAHVQFDLPVKMFAHPGERARAGDCQPE